MIIKSKVEYSQTSYGNQNTYDQSTISFLDNLTALTTHEIYKVYHS